MVNLDLIKMDILAVCIARNKLNLCEYICLKCTFKYLTEYFDVSNSVTVAHILSMYISVYLGLCKMILKA